MSSASEMPSSSTSSKRFSGGSVVGIMSPHEDAFNVESSSGILAKSIPWPCYHVTDQLIELSEINVGGTTWNRSAPIAAAPPRDFKMGEN